MRTTCNPGRVLEVEGSFALVPGILAGHPVVIDRASNLPLDLHELLQQFLEDPSETITRPIRIRIEPATLDYAGDIVANETRSELITRGWLEGDADQATALKVFMARACTPDLRPTQADHDYQRGAIAARAYLEQVAPEELER